MSPFNLTLDGVEAWKGGNGPPPPGEYMCRIDDAGEGYSSNNHPQIELSLSVATGEFQGATLRDWVVVIPETLGKVRQLLEAAGMQIPQGEFQMSAHDLRGRSVQAVIREEDWRGKKRTRVIGYGRPGAQPAGPAANGQPQQPQPISVGAPTGSSQHDADIPF